MGGCGYVGVGVGGCACICVCSLSPSRASCRRTSPTGVRVWGGRGACLCVCVSVRGLVGGFVCEHGYQSTHIHTKVEQKHLSHTHGHTHKCMHAFNPCMYILYTCTNSLPRLFTSSLPPSSRSDADQARIARKHSHRHRHTQAHITEIRREL